MRRCRSCGERFEPARSHHYLCWDCWREQNPSNWHQRRETAPSVQAVAVLDAATIKSAIALCHPDVHPPERRERALRVTQALTGALDRTRQLERAA